MKYDIFQRSQTCGDVGDQNVEVLPFASSSHPPAPFVSPSPPFSTFPRPLPSSSPRVSSPPPAFLRSLPTRPSWTITKARKVATQMYDFNKSMGCPCWYMHMFDFTQLSSRSSLYWGYKKTQIYPQKCKSHHPKFATTWLCKTEGGRIKGFHVSTSFGLGGLP